MTMTDGKGSETPSRAYDGPMGAGGTHGIMPGMGIANTPGNGSGSGRDAGGEDSNSGGGGGGEQPSGSGGGGGGGSGQHLNIKVTDNNNEVFFKIRRSTKLEKLMNAFCDRQGKQLSQVRFLFEGQRVQPNDTPDTVGILFHYAGSLPQEQRYISQSHVMTLTRTLLPL